MIFNKTTLADAWLLELEKRGDSRGFFARTMCVDEFATHGLVTTYFQQNTSFSAEAGTVRGMHFQRAPVTEAKLVRCLKGAIADVIIDLRRNSPTFLKHEKFELTDENRRHLYVPPGFAHGFQTLVPDTEVSYLVSAPYTPAAEFGVRYDDPEIGINWPAKATAMSDRDKVWPFIDPSKIDWF